MTIASFLLALSGFALFALSLPRHRRQAGLRSPTAQRPIAMRGSALLVIGCSWLIALTMPQRTIAAVEWVGLASAAAACTVALLILRPTLLRAAVWYSLAIGALAGIAGTFNPL